MNASFSLVSSLGLHGVGFEFVEQVRYGEEGAQEGVEPGACHCIDCEIQASSRQQQAHANAAA